MYVCDKVQQRKVHTRTVGNPNNGSVQIHHQKIKMWTKKEIIVFMNVFLFEKERTNGTLYQESSKTLHLPFVTEIYKKICSETENTLVVDNPSMFILVLLPSLRHKIFSLFLQNLIPPSSPQLFCTSLYPTSQLRLSNPYPTIPFSSLFLLGFQDSLTHPLPL